MSTPAETCRASALANPQQEDLAKLQERAKAKGWSITPTAVGFLVGRWGMSRTFADLAEVEQFLTRAGVPR